MVSPLEKGNALEAVVRAIETTILHTSPALKEKTFSIESKKRIVVGGVTHEIDIYVEVDLGKGYRSIFVFECKNWEDAVGKNEIIVLSEKINALQAQTGFLVAKSYTRDAKAQASKDARMTLLIAKEHDPTGMLVPFDFHFVSQEKGHADIELIERGTGERHHAPVDAANVVVTLGGVIVDFDKYIRDWITSASDDGLRTFPSGSLPEGLHDREVKSERTFEPGELLVDGRDMELARLHGKFSTRVIRPSVVSHFEVSE